MLKIKLFYCACTLTVISLLGGCGSSSGPQSTPTQQSSIVTGPVQYDVVSSKVLRKNFSASVDGVNDVKLKTSTDVTPLIDGALDIGAALFPEAEIALDVSEALIDLWDENSDSDDTGQNAINAMQTQLTNLQNQLISTNTYLAQFISTQTNTNYTTAYANLLSNIANIIVYANGNSSLSQGNQYINGSLNPLVSGSADATLYGNFYSRLVNNDINQTGVNYAAMKKLASYINNTRTQNQNASPATIMNTISGSYLQSDYNKSLPNFIPQSMTQFEVQTPIGSGCMTNGTLSGTLQCLNEYFVDTYICNNGTGCTATTYPNLNDGNTTLNLAQMIDGYNNTILSIYQQVLLAIQTVFQVEVNINNLNYINYANCSSNPSSFIQLPYLENQDLTYFSMPSCDSNSSAALTNAKNAYLTAQHNLAMYYARRMNGLFDYVMNYVISDPLVNGQSYVAPSENNVTVLGQTIPLVPQAQLYTTIATTDYVNIPWQNLSGVNGVFYQLPALRNVYSCKSIFAEAPDYNASGPAKCVLSNVFSSDMNGSYYDGVNFSVYAPDGNNSFTQTNQLNYVNFCSQNGQVAINQNILMCQRYSAGNFRSYGNMAPPPYGFDITHEWDFEAIYMQATPLGATIPIPLTDSNSSNQTNLLSSSITLQSTGMNNLYNAYGILVSNVTLFQEGSYIPKWSTFAFQLTLPSGVIFPYFYNVVSTAGAFNSAIGTSYGCPIGVNATNPNSQIPGIASCEVSGTSIIVTDFQNIVYTFTDEAIYQEVSPVWFGDGFKTDQDVSMFGFMSAGISGAYNQSNPPPGDYQQTCLPASILWRNSVLRATCGMAGGGYNQSELNYAQSCVPGTWVTSGTNGVLACENPQ